MVTTFCLVTCALVGAQATNRPDWLLTPRLGRGHELVYAGTFSEEVAGQGVQFNRSYRLETNVFVLDSGPRHSQAAFLTVLEMRALRPERIRDASTPSSVRLEVVRIGLQGRIEGNEGSSLLVPLEGPPTVECGAFVELPNNRVGKDSTWEINEPGRPPRSWRVAGSEIIQNTSCIKLVGQQQSEDWDRPRADRTAWRRRDTVWMAPAAGFAYRVERVIERREPARRATTQRAILRYDLMSRLTYPGKLYEDRQREILQARRFHEEAVPFITHPGQSERQLDALLKRIGYHLDNQPAIQPYRKAVLQVKRRVEAARRGEVAPVPVPEERNGRPSVAAIGQQAPDFVATDLLKQESIRLHRLLGKPVLLVFVNPTFATARAALSFAAEKQRQGVAVLGLSVVDEADAVKKLHTEMRLPFPLAAGKAFKVTFGVDATPRLILLDADGVIRGTYTGWGSETPGEIAEDIKRWKK